MSQTTRRIFLATSLAPAFSTKAFGFPKNETISVGIIGMGGRGSELMKELGKFSNVNVAHFCDPDAKRLESAADNFDKAFKRKPPTAADFRTILDDKALNAVFI